MQAGIFPACIDDKKGEFQIMYNYTNVTTLYVSQKNGNDRFTGFYKESTADFQGPVKSIEKAIEKVSQMRSFGAIQPVSIVITDDIYFLENPIVIDESVFSLTITSENKTVISGGRKIENFVYDSYNGKDCFSAPVFDIDSGFWFTDLYVDNKRADFTHYPQNGKLKADDVENRSTDLHASSKWFIAKKEDFEIIKNFKNFNDCFISYNHFWVDEHTPVESYDSQTGKIVFKYPSRFTIEPTHPASELNYIIENVSEYFCNENEWYLDRQTKRVYYIPRSDKKTPESITVYAPVTDKLFIIKGTKEKKVKNIRFENLIFSDTKGDYRSVYSQNSETGCIEESTVAYASDSQAVSNAHGSIEFYYASGCFFENCIIRNIGVHAITVNEGCSRIIISDNDMYDLGAGAIKINGGAYGCDKEDETYGNIVRNNIITDSGNRYFSACAVLMMHTYENIISQNEISYQYYTGISSGWVWGYKDSITHDNIIEKNHIHHIGQGKLSDMGAVYLLGNQPGTIVRNNIIHDVVSSHYGALGLYTDEGSSGMLFENNICYNITGNCFGQHFGHQNTVRNNIFVKSDESPIGMSKEELHIGMLFEKNIIVTKGTSVYRVGYPGKPSGAIHMIASNNNILYDESGEVFLFEADGKKYTLSEIKEKFGIEIESICENPEFVDFENNNFELKNNSPALKLGFKNIKTDEIGVKRR